MSAPVDEKKIKTLTLRLSPSLRARLEAQAKEEGVSIGHIVRRLVERGSIELRGTKKNAM